MDSSIIMGTISTLLIKNVGIHSPIWLKGTIDVKKEVEVIQVHIWFVSLVREAEAGVEVSLVRLYRLLHKRLENGNPIRIFLSINRLVLNGLVVIVRVFKIFELEIYFL